MITLAAALLLSASFISVQVGSFSEEQRALSVIDDLRTNGYDAYFLRAPSLEEGVSTYKVRVGKYEDSTKARADADKIRKLGFSGAFPTPTDRAETQNLSSDIVQLVIALGKVNPGAIKPEDGDGLGKRLADYTRNYLVLYLLDAGFDPGARVTDLAVWDTNPDNQPEIFAVVDGTRAWALFWQKAQSRYALAEMEKGQKVSIGTVWDLAPGPEKFIAIQYERGGDLYLERGYGIYRWDQANQTYAQVGRLPLEITDKGVDGGIAEPHKRSVDVKDVDTDRDRELLVTHTVGSRSHVDVWDWANGRLDRVDRSEWFEKVLASRGSDTDAADGLFGLGIDRGLADDLKGAQQVFQLLVSKYPSFAVAARAQEAIQQIGDRQRQAEALNQTGFDEIKAGAPDLAAQDLTAAAALDPGNPRIHYNLAVARNASGDTLGALRALARAVELDKAGTLEIRKKAKADPALGTLHALRQFEEIVQ